MNRPLLCVRNLRVAFRTSGAPVPVVKGISFDLQPGESVGLVGESGCGKSVTVLALMGLLSATQAVIQADRLHLGSTDLLSLSPAGTRKIRGRQLAMIFQEPGTSLDPVFTIGSQVTSAIRRCTGAGRAIAAARALEALEEVGFANPDPVFKAYPHQLSGGMRQLVMIAMAMAIKPAVLLADEPTTALDVTTQMIVLSRLQHMREELGTSIVLVTHDLAVMAQMCERAMVMYCGRIVEQADCRSLFNHPRHPYSNGLLGAVPRLTAGEPVPVKAIRGQLPGLNESIPGCQFAPRCKRADRRCNTDSPDLSGSEGRLWACHHPL